VLPGPGRTPILDNVADDFIDPVDWGLANAAGFGIGRAVTMRADHRFRKSGRVQCALRVIEGDQPGLSSRWRLGVASVYPRRLNFRRRWRRVLGEDPPIKVLAVHGPPRAPLGSPRSPFGDEILKLPGSVVRIQTPSAMLEWALHSRFQPAAFARLKVDYRIPVVKITE
jgi:hypothetical protein